MDFIDQLKQFSKRIEQLKDQITTEEATKTSLIMPFFQILGYDVFNPSEFIPEYTADVGIKKGEKVDYAILKNGDPIILIEAKWCGEALEKHDSQLFRYFGTTKAKFAILTNGIDYRFYTDLDEPNKMDPRPFLEFSILDVKDSIVIELKKFQKVSFDMETILNSASELKYSNLIRQFIAKELANPSDSFVSYILGEVYSGRKTQNVIDKFKDVVKKSLNNYVNELMSDRFKQAMEKQENEQPQQKVEQPIEVEEIVSRVETTEEEKEGLFIVKSLFREIVPVERVTSKDTESYFGILLDNNSWKWICRLQLNTAQKYVIIPDLNKNQIKYPINNVYDMYNLKNELEDSLKRHLT